MSNEAPLRLGAVAAVGLYRRGTAWDPALPLGAQPAAADHIAYLGRLVATGSVLAAGPFRHPDALVVADLVGLALLACDAATARALLDQDPAVVAGMMTCEVLAWYP